MIRVQDIADRHNCTFYFAGVAFNYNPIFNDYIVVKYDPETKRIWL